MPPLPGPHGPPGNSQSSMSRSASPSSGAQFTTIWSMCHRHHPECLPAKRILSGSWSKGTLNLPQTVSFSAISAKFRVSDVINGCHLATRLGRVCPCGSAAHVGEHSRDRRHFERVQRRFHRDLHELFREASLTTSTAIISRSATTTTNMVEIAPMIGRMRRAPVRAELCEFVCQGCARSRRIVRKKVFRCHNLAQRLTQASAVQSPCW